MKTGYQWLYIAVIQFAKFAEAKEVNSHNNIHVYVYIYIHTYFKWYQCIDMWLLQPDSRKKNWGNKDVWICEKSEKAAHKDSDMLYFAENNSPKKQRSQHKTSNLQNIISCLFSGVLQSQKNKVTSDTNRDSSYMCDRHWIYIWSHFVRKRFFLHNVFL